MKKFFIDYSSSWVKTLRTISVIMLVIGLLTGFITFCVGCSMYRNGSPYVIAGLSIFFGTILFVAPLFTLAAISKHTLINSVLLKEILQNQLGKEIVFVKNFADSVDEAPKQEPPVA